MALMRGKLFVGKLFHGTLYGMIVAATYIMFARRRNRR